MTALRDALARMRTLLRLRAERKELDEEFAFHLEMAERKLRSEGVSPDEAARIARQRFGSPARQRDQARWAWGLGGMEDLIADLRLVGRHLRRSPGFVAGAVLTLALGIGATTAIFSVAREALLVSPPVYDSGRVAVLYTTCRRGEPRCSSSWPDFMDYREQSRTFADMAAYSSVPLNVETGTGTARLADGALVSSNYFSLLGVRAHTGRVIQVADGREGGGDAVVVLGHRFWQTAFGADPGIVGRSIRLNGAPFEVVGVSAEGFEGLDLQSRTDVWFPILDGPALGPAAGGASEADAASNRGMRWIGTLVGRLAPDATFGMASAEMDAISARLGQQYPDERAAIGGTRGITVDPLTGYVQPRGSEARLRQFMGLLLVTVAVTLLLACANLANLLLARATARQAEIGIRMATGAGRGRVLRQLLTESAALALLGAAAGLLVAGLMLRALSGFELPGGVGIGSLGVNLDPVVLGFAFALALGTTLVFGLIPALETARLDLVAVLKGGEGRAAARLGKRKALIALQVALSVVLLTGAGLFLRTLQESARARLGFEPEGVVAARFNLALLGYSEPQASSFVDRLLAEVRGLPGVEAASVATLVPFQNAGFRGTFAEIDGYQPQPDEEIRVDWVPAEPGYFHVLGTPVLDGSALPRASAAGGPTSIVINRFMAERYWPGASPVGRTVSIFNTTVRVAGVVENPVWVQAGEEPTSFVWVPLDEVPILSSSYLTLVARTGGDAADIVAAVRDRFRAIEPALSLTSLQTMDEQVAAALLPQRMGSLLFSLFGTLALVLSALGVYGVVSYHVQRRARDIGIRIAVGASRQRILSGVLRELVTPVAVGLVVGTALGIAAGRALDSFLYGVSGIDPASLGVSVVLLVLVALAATLRPALRAARLDPVRVLRVE